MLVRTPLSILRKLRTRQLKELVKEDEQEEMNEDFPSPVHHHWVQGMPAGANFPWASSQPNYECGDLDTDEVRDSLQGYKLKDSDLWFHEEQAHPNYCIRHFDTPRQGSGSSIRYVASAI